MNGTTVFYPHHRWQFFRKTYPSSTPRASDHSKSKPWSPKTLNILKKYRYTGGKNYIFQLNSNFESKDTFKGFLGHKMSRMKLKIVKTAAKKW